MTTNDLEIDASQGWALELVYDTRGYFALAIVPTKGSIHASSYEARRFVWEAAKLGDAVCRKALSIVMSSEVEGQNKKKARKK